MQCDTYVKERGYVARTKFFNGSRWGVDAGWANKLLNYEVVQPQAAAAIRVAFVDTFARPRMTYSPHADLTGRLGHTKPAGPATGRDAGQQAAAGQSGSHSKSMRPCT